MKDNDKNEKKLPDINYALMAQLSYLKWNNIENKKIIENQPVKTILLTDTILSQIKTDFYNDRKNYHSNEKLNNNGDNGELEKYTYHEEDKRLFLIYSLEKGEDEKAGKPFFENIIDGWEYLDCATGEIIQNKFFPPELLKGYEESGFFGIAFQRGNNIMIAYRGTEDKTKHNNKFIAEDIITDVKIYFKKTDIQQVEAVLFYEYIKTKYGEGKNIHITGHSLAGAIAQYVHFYTYYNNDNVFTETWNGLGAYGSILHTEEFFLHDSLPSLFQKKISSINEEKYKSSKKRLKDFYSTSLNILKEKRKEIVNSENIINYFMDEDFVGGYFNGDWIGKKVLVNIKDKTLFNEIAVFEENQKPDYSKPYGGGKVNSYINIKSKKDTAFMFHNVNNFLVFMGDSGNIMPCVIRQEFRSNTLKTVVTKKIKSYNTLIEKGKEIELIKNDTDPYNVYKDIISPSNRLIGKGFVVPISAITQKDLLFVESFEGENSFKSYDMQVEKEDKIEGQRRYKGKIILGKYNNIASLGGIIGKEPLEIKVYVNLPDKEETQETSDTVSKGNDYQKKVHGIK